MSYIEMFGKDTHKTLHVTYRSYQQKKLNQTRHVSFLIGGTREKICAKNGSYRIYIRIRVSVFGRRTLMYLFRYAYTFKFSVSNFQGEFKFYSLRAIQGYLFLYFLLFSLLLMYLFRYVTSSNQHFKAFLVSKINSETSFLY